MEKIKTFEEYRQLVNRYDRKGRMTNDYLQNGAADLIIHDRLYVVCGEDNAFFWVQKNGFYRLYYYVNNAEEVLEMPDSELVTEILFRGEDAPEAEVQWLKRIGFKKNLVRDQYFAKYSSVTSPGMIRGLKIGLATTEEDALWAIKLFNASFDKWSGDYIPVDMDPLLIQEQAILLAKDDEHGSRLGALKKKKKKGVTWLHHLAVSKEARGMGVGRGLVEACIEQGHVDDNSRYMLWVQRQNIPAVNLYKKKGFAPMNKSTLSMIKL